MVEFAITELANGLTVVELHPGQTPEDAAASRGGVLADPEPYPTYKEAYDALMDLQEEDEE